MGAEYHGGLASWNCPGAFALEARAIDGTVSHRGHAADSHAAVHDYIAGSWFKY
jgi:hypothetical protein